MALQSSGQISLNDIHVELGESSGTEVSLNDSDVLGLISFSSGSEIELADFYGASSGPTDMTSQGTINNLNYRQQATASDFISSGGKLRIPSNFYCYSNNINTPALIIDIPCEVTVDGVIMGRGGRGGCSGRYGAISAPQSGGDAVRINSGVSGVTIIINSGAYVFGGGGGGGAGAGSSGMNGSAGCAGGGGGAGGGEGGWGLSNNISGFSPHQPAVAGGAIGLKGSDHFSAWGGNGGSGGGSGGGSNGVDNGGWSSNVNAGPSGGGGGRMAANTGFTAYGGSGTNSTGGRGYFSSTGQNAQGTHLSGAGGGGFGQNGGNQTYHSYSGIQTGGSGGKAINDNGQTYTLTNNGYVLGGT